MHCYTSHHTLSTSLNAGDVEARDWPISLSFSFPSTLKQFFDRDVKHGCSDYFDPPFRPASFAASLPGSNDPPEALPPMDAISFYGKVRLNALRSTRS